MKAIREIQRIRLGGEEAVVVPLALWRHILERLEDLEDLEAFDRALARNSLRDGRHNYVDHAELCRMIGRNPLKYLRRVAGLTQAELARRAGVSQSLIARSESGKRRLSGPVLRRVARALDVRPEELEY